MCENYTMGVQSSHGRFMQVNADIMKNTDLITNNCSYISNISLQNCAWLPVAMARMTEKKIMI